MQILIFILAEVAFGRLHSSTEGHSSSQGGPLSMTLPVLGSFRWQQPKLFLVPKYCIIPCGFPIKCVVFVQFLSHSLCDPMVARFPCPPLFPGVCSNLCSLSWWYNPTILSSATLFSFCLQSFSASGSFPVSQLFTSGGQSTWVSASATVLPDCSELISFKTDWFEKLETTHVPQCSL